MSLLNHACIPSALFIHPDFHTTGKRSVEGSMILGLFAGGYQYLSVRKALSLVLEHTRHRTTYHQIRKTFEYLVNNGWIIPIDKGSYFRYLREDKTVRIASTWEMTDKFKSVCLQSDKFYKSLSSWRNRKAISFDINSITVNTSSYYCDWERILPESNDTITFISSLAKLENNTVFFDRKTALEEYYRGNIKPKGAMPAYGKTALKYYPLKTGRLQSDPHAYLGKALVPFITPAEDKKLKYGTLFSLDFSSQELRLLASFTGNGQLQRDVKYEDDLFDIIYYRLPQYLKDVMKNIKSHFYAITYGSNGQSLTKDLHEKTGAPINIANSLAQSFFREIDRMYPEIKRFQRKIEQELQSKGHIKAPGGVVRVAGDDDGITTKNKVNKNYAHRTALSHYIQGGGATVTRHIVTESVNLKHCRLHIPIHDGFVFYTTGDIDLAVQEAELMMKECASKVAGDINMPVKMEWKRDNNGLDYF